MNLVKKTTKKKPIPDDNAFTEHGGYMAVKIQKLEDQFSVLQKEFQKSNLFEGKYLLVSMFQ